MTSDSCRAVAVHGLPYVGVRPRLLQRAATDARMTTAPDSQQGTLRRTPGARNGIFRSA